MKHRLAGRGHAFTSCLVATPAPCHQVLRIIGISRQNHYRLWSKGMAQAQKVIAESEAW